MSLGKKPVARLCGVAKALAEEAARADGDFGLLEVVAVARGVDGGVGKDEEALELVVLEHVR